MFFWKSGHAPSTSFDFMCVPLHTRRCGVIYLRLSADLTTDPTTKENNHWGSADVGNGEKMTQVAQFITQIPTRGRRIKFTAERLEQIRNLVERGKSREEIAELIGVTVGSLQVTCSRLGISLRRPFFNTGLLRRGGPPSNNGMHNPSSDVPSQPTEQQQNSQGAVGQGQGATPHQERARTNETGVANFAIKMQYRGEERTTELPLTQDMIRQLAFEAQFRDMSIGELVGEFIKAMMKKHVF